MLCDGMILDKVKDKSYRTMGSPITLHGSRCRVSKVQHVHKMSMTEMQMLRWMFDIRIMDVISNDYIYQRVHVGHMGIRGHLRWFDHV